MAEKHAIYFQRSKVVKQEFNLIEIATERELAVGKLEAIIKDVKEKRKELIDDVILDIFRLMNNVRSSTIRLIKAISLWQKSFTKPIRPTIYECDYIVEKVIKHIDFLNASNIRKIFNFQFYRGNALLLPYPNLQNSDPIKVHSSLAKEIKIFAFPNEEDIIFCYQFFINCLPEPFYRDRLVPLHKWLVEPWMPRIWVTNSIEPCFLSSAQIAAAIRESRRASLTSNNSSNNNPHPLRSRRMSTATSTSSNTGQAADNSANNPYPSSPGGGGRVGSPTSMKRRLDLQKKDLQQVLLVAALADSSTTDPSNTNDGNEELVKEDEKYLTEEQRQELRQLDDYYQELEGMFLPQLGRRAVQTIVAGGERHQLPTGHQEFVYHTNKVLFMQSQRGAEQLIEAANNNGKGDSFARTNAQLVAKKNRLLQDRKQLAGGINAIASASADTEDDNDEASTAAESGTTTAPSAISPALLPPALVGAPWSPVASPASNSSLGRRKLTPMQRLASRGQDSRRMSDLTVSFSVAEGINNFTRSSIHPISRTSQRRSSVQSSGSSVLQARCQSPPLSLSTKGMKEWFQSQQAIVQEQELQRRTQSLRR